jgi:hypothetical protein
MRFRGVILIAALLPMAGCASEETRLADRIIHEAVDRGRGYEKLTYLTDRIGPRLSGSQGLDRAVAWAAADLRADGLDHVWTEKVMVPHWVRGDESGRVVAPVDHPLALTALGGSMGTPEGGLEAEVIEVAGFEELTAAGPGARGRIVLYNKPILPDGGEKHGYGSASRLRFRGAVEAAKVGAVGMLIRSLGTASFRLPHTGAMGYEDSVERIPGAAISAEDADLIHRFLAAGETVKVRYSLGCRTLPDAESANVLAELRGRETPSEIVLIAAHLDSWDLATGAIDDGAGVAIVMETMRVLRSLHLAPRRTIRAVLFTNEENGLRGGRAYAEAHKDEQSAHVAAIESDSGGARPLGFDVSAGAGGEAVVRAIVAHLSGIEATRVAGGGGGADISPLKAAGVPLLSLRQDTAHYFDYHHTSADTLDKVDPRDLARNVAALSVMAYMLADRADPLPRLEPAPPEGAAAPGRPGGS